MTPSSVHRLLWLGALLFAALGTPTSLLEKVISNVCQGSMSRLLNLNVPPQKFLNEHPENPNRLISLSTDSTPELHKTNPSRSSAPPGLRPAADEAHGGQKCEAQQGSEGSEEGLESKTRNKAHPKNKKPPIVTEYNVATL